MDAGVCAGVHGGGSLNTHREMHLLEGVHTTASHGSRRNIHSLTHIETKADSAITSSDEIVLGVFRVLTIHEDTQGLAIDAVGLQSGVGAAES